MLNFGLINEGDRSEILVALVQRVETRIGWPALERAAAVYGGAPSRVLISWLQASNSWSRRSTSRLGLP